MCQESRHAPVRRGFTVVAVLLGRHLRQSPIASAAPSSPCVGHSSPAKMMPMPYLPASVMPDGEICDATNERASPPASGRICSAGVVHGETSRSWRFTRLAVETNRRMMAMASSWRSRCVPSDRCRACARRRASAPRVRSRRMGAASRHVVELYHAPGRH